MNLSIAILLTVILTFSGTTVHELIHYALGRLFGSQPFFSDYFVVIPTEVDFYSPKSMSNMQTRLTGGGVLIFPFLLGIGLALIPPKELVPNLPYLSFLLGGSIISDLDLLAARQPEVWKRWTDGEKVSRYD